MKILINNEIPIRSWQEFLIRNFYSSPFQSPDFFHLINSVPGFSAYAVAIQDSDILVALAVITIHKEPGIKKYLSQRGIIYGGPLIDAGYPEVFSLLLNQIPLITGNRNIYHETRNFFDFNQYKEIFHQRGWEFIPYLNITLDLNGKTKENVISGMDYNRRREIRLSFEMGAVYKVCETETELVAFYNILSDLYKTRVKLPLPGFHFFKAFWQSGFSKVFIVKHRDLIIGGSFCIIQPEKVIYTMYYCGLRKYNSKIYPAHLAVLAAIDFGILNGLRYLDFMGAGKKGEEYGVRKYKLEFGGILNENGRYRRISKPLLFKIGLIGLKILRRKIK